jgi:predicted MFS family arabinose efflux permease
MRETEGAAFIGALVGPMQVAGRIVEFTFAKHATPSTVGMIALLAFPVAVLVLAFGGPDARVMAAFAALWGASNGVMTIVRGTVPAEIWGQDGYGGLTGLMATPVLIARAVGPFFAAWLLSAMGGYVPMALAFAAIGVVSWAAFAAAVHFNRR